MEGYSIGDISSLLNSTTTPVAAPSNDLFSATPTTTPVSLEEIYAKPAAKRAKKDKKKKEDEKEEKEDGKEGVVYQQLSPEEKLAIDKRTLFIGNLPIGSSKKQLHRVFREFGKIESMRFRSVAVSDLKLGKKVCMKANKVNENATNKNAYIVFASEECVAGAVAKNGTKIGDNCIRVDKVVKSKKEQSDDQQKSIFVGNMPFGATEEEVREALAQCGEIEYVRLTRDKETNIGKGFGYVKFVDSAGVLLAMKIKDSVKVGGRQLRIQRCKSKVTLENKKKISDEKKKKKEEEEEGRKKGGFRGRKSKGTDKDLFKTKPPAGKKAFKPPGKGSNKQKPISKRKFDKKVNKASKKNPAK